MNLLRKNGPGILLCLAIAVPSWFLGDVFPIIGGAVIAILAGMLVALFFKDKASYEPGIKIVSKKVLQWAVILLGFDGPQYCSPNGKTISADYHMHDINFAAYRLYSS